MITRKASCGLIVLTCLGCVPSLHGLAGRNNSVMDERLNGNWLRTLPETSAEESPATWTFTPRDDRTAYRLRYTDAFGSSGEFLARLTKIDEQFYLDLFPMKPHKLEEVNAEDLSGFYRHHLMPVHTFVRIDRWEPTLQLSFLDLRRMDQYLQDHPDAIAHERTDVNSDLLLTASTEELRKFIGRMQGVQDLFTSPVSLSKAEDSDTNGS